jgi:hypothetical protein
LSDAARLLVDGDSVSISAAVQAAAQAAPFLVVTGRAVGDLARELGSMDAATRWLATVAEQNKRPIGVNLPAPDGSSQTAFIAPRDWTQERLQGWVAGRHAELEAEFGEVAGLSSLGR